MKKNKFLILEIIIFCIVVGFSMQIGLRETLANYGVTEQPASPQQNWLSIASSDDGQKLAAAGYGNFYYSLDNGLSWTLSSLGISDAIISIASSADGSRLAMVRDYSSSDGYVLTSTDGGTHWSERVVLGSSKFYSIASSADGVKLVATASSGYVYISNDGGQTWDSIGALTGVGDFRSVAMSDDGLKIAVAGLHGALRTSTDGGLNWISRTSDAGGQTWASITSSADGNFLAVAPANGKILTSSNGGATWTLQENSSHKSWKSITVSSDGSKIAAIVSGVDYVYASVDYGVTWREVEGGYGEWASVASSADGEKLAFAPLYGYIHTADIIPIPSILSITSTNDDGVYKVGDNISIDIVFSELVDSSGNVTLTFETGIIDRTCEFQILNSTEATCNFIVQEGDVTSDLNVSSISGIINRAGDGSVLIIDYTPNTSLATNKNIVIDGITPTITNISSNKTNGAYKVGEVIDIDVTFSEAVTSTGNITVTLETGSTDRTCTFAVSNSTTGTCDYTVQSGDTSSDLTVSSVSGTIADQAGNLISNFSPSTNLATNKSLIIDTTPPTVSITSPTEGATVSGSSVSIVATASDTNLVGVQFKRDTNTNIGAEDTTSTYGVVWDTTVLPDGSQYLIAVARDLAGNYATSTVVSVTVDNTVEDEDEPVVSYPLPSGVQSEGTTQVTLQVATNENATCKYGSVANTPYGSIASTFGTTGGTTHTQIVTGLRPDTSYEYYVRCSDIYSNITTLDTLISFSIPKDTPMLNDNEEDSSPKKKGSVIQTVSNTFTSAVSRSVNRINNLFSDFTKTVQEEPQNEEKILDLIEKLKQEFLKLLESGEVGMTPLNQNPSQTFTMDLEIGDSNEEVRLLQAFLNNNGYIVAETGPGSIGSETTIFGAATQVALVRFQKDNNIVPSVGYFGPITRNLINSL